MFFSLPITINALFKVMKTNVTWLSHVPRPRLAPLARLLKVISLQLKKIISGG